MKYLYIFSELLLIIGFLFIKISNNKRSIIISVVYTIGLCLCFNIFLVYINYYLKIGSSLLVLSIINILLSIIFFIIVKVKGRQKYYLSKKELLGLVILSTILFVICLLRFNCFNNISYESGDSSIHYKMAICFRENMNLLDKNNTNDIVYSFDRSMPGYYVNAGLFMKILDNYNSYKVYMLFDSLFFILVSCLFLVTIYSLKKDSLFLVIIVSLLYCLGYPFNNLIFGFGYLGMGILTINMLFLTYIFYPKFKDNLLYKNILLFIINFGIFYSYSLFVPIIYLSEGLYYIINYFKKEIKLKELIFYLISLVIPFILGFIYFIYPMFVNTTGGDNFFKIKGYIYSGIGSIFVMICIIFIKLLKVKYEYLFDKITFSIFLFVLLMFTFLMIFCGFEGYYYFKLFYIIWLVCFIIFVKIFDFVKIKKYLVFVSIFIVIVTCNVFINYSEDNIINDVFVYSYNFSRIKKSSVINEKELDIINKSMKYTDCVTYNRFYVSSYNSELNLWYYSITGRIPTDKYDGVDSRSLEDLNVDITRFERSSNKCVIYLFRNNKVIDYSKFNKLYENEAGVILKKE